MQPNGRFLFYAVDCDGRTDILRYKSLKEAVARGCGYLNEFKAITGNKDPKWVRESITTCVIIDLKKCQEIAELIWFSNDDLVLAGSEEDDPMFDDVPYMIDSPLVDSRRIFWHYSKFDGRGEGVGPEPKTYGSIAVVNGHTTYRKVFSGWIQLSLEQGDEPGRYRSWLELHAAGEVKVIFETPA